MSTSGSDERLWKMSGVTLDLGCSATEDKDTVDDEEEEEEEEDEVETFRGETEDEKNEE